MWKYSGVFEGVTTGTPIGLLIRNTDQRSKDYSKIKESVSPGACRLYPISRSTGCATIEVVVDPLRARPLCGSLQVP